MAPSRHVHSSAWLTVMSMLLLIALVLPTSSATAGASPAGPAAFGKGAPANGAQNLANILRLRWAASEEAATYQYCIDTIDNDACDRDWVDAGSSTAARARLAERTTYYWQVRALKDGEVTDADGGAWWSFRTGVGSRTLRNGAPAPAQDRMEGAAAAPAAGVVGPTNLIVDGGFESFLPTYDDPYWGEYSYQFSTPLCTVALCGNGGGTASPRTGSVWAWFGGTTDYEETALWQDVTFPACVGATLQFYFRIGKADVGSGVDDYAAVWIDDTLMWSANATQRSSYATYKPVSVNLGAFSDGGVHTVDFESVTSGQIVNFSIDDVALVPGTTSTGCANVKVDIGGVNQGRYVTQKSDSNRLSYASNAGPVVVADANGLTPIIASERVAYSDDAGVTWSSFSEIMGLPSNQLTTSYVMPWYNNADLNTQVRFGNVGTAGTNVTVTIGGVVQGVYPLAPNQSMRISYPGLNSGPVVVSSSGGVKIIASQRVAYSPDGGTTWPSFTELMGLPSPSLTSAYWLPVYDNVTHNDQLRFGNVGAALTYVTVTVGGVVQGMYPVAPSQSVRVSYASLNDGPVQVTSTGNVPIIVSHRVAYTPDGGTTWSHFAELMALPGNQLSTSYVMPWYNNVDLNTQLRFAVP